MWIWGLLIAGAGLGEPCFAGLVVNGAGRCWVVLGGHCCMWRMLEAQMASPRDGDGDASRKVWHGPCGMRWLVIGSLRGLS